MAGHPGDSARRAQLANWFRAEVPPPPRSEGPPRRPRRLEVFAVGTDWAQLTWSALGPGTVQVDGGGAPVVVAADGGPGAVTVPDLPAGAAVTLRLCGPGVPDGSVSIPTTTLPRPPGELLHRFATVSDTHIGSSATGYLHTIVEKPAPIDAHPVRCLRAALEEASRWRAAEVVVKGDLVDSSEADHWATAGHLLAALEVPVWVIPGNHERTRGDLDPAEALDAVGLRLVDTPVHLDRPGIRLILADSTRPGRDTGRSHHLASPVVELAASTDAPVLIALHHQPTVWALPTYLPPGIPGPEARRFLHALADANPRALVTAGHTHRHRRRQHGPVTITEVGSTKDFPGTWAGYEVYEGGIVQTVPRIAEPSCIRWTDWTRRAAGGLWQHWSPGRLDDRCFTITWP